MPVGRFAPTPSGELHLGSLRTAAAAWLFARQAGSAFLVRVEDLDPNVSRHGFEEGQLADLTAIGVDWDGPVVRQSERRARYDAALTALVERGVTYECFCTRREIREASTAPHVVPGTYPGTCRDLTAGERAAARRSGRRPAVRLRGDGAVVRVTDDLRGAVEARVDDVVLRRNDGVAAYNLAVVVDDAAQGVEQVVRAEDLLPVAPTQAHLCDLLGLARPRWAHVPLVVGPDGVRLAKRHGSVTLAELRSAGVTIESVVGWIGRGLGVDDVDGARSVADLLAGFHAAAIPAGAATVHDLDGGDLGTSGPDRAAAGPSTYGRRP